MVSRFRFGRLRLFLTGFACVAGCGPSGSFVPDAGGIILVTPEASSTSTNYVAPAQADLDAGAFVARDEWTGPCTASANGIDVNLGNSPDFQL